MNNNLALNADQIWKWTASSFSLTIGGNLDNGGHLLTINGQNGNAGEKFNGAISGTGGLTLSSNAAVTLSGTNTYTGNTIVNGGKLVINTNGSIANSLGIALASGTTLDFSAPSSFTVSGGQTLSGGVNGTATIRGPGTLTLATGAQAAYTVAGNANSNSVIVGNSMCWAASPSTATVSTST